MDFSLSYHTFNVFIFLYIINMKRKTSHYGPLLWKLMYKLSEDIRYKQLLEYVIRGLCQYIPCIYCRMSLCSYLMKYPITEHTNLYKYIHELHRDVKIKLLYQKYLNTNKNDGRNSDYIRYIKHRLPVNNIDQHIYLKKNRSYSCKVSDVLNKLESLGIHEQFIHNIKTFYEKLSKINKTSIIVDCIRMRSYLE